MTLLTTAGEVWRGLLRSCFPKRPERRRPALETNPEIARRLRIAEMGNQLARELAALPADDHPAVVAHVAWAVGLHIVHVCAPAAIVPPAAGGSLN